MAWVEIEEDSSPAVLLAGAFCIPAGLVAWWWYDLGTGVVVYLFVGWSVILVRGCWLQMLLPSEARRAAKMVLAWFREQFPEERIEGVAVRAVEPERFIIAVRHGFGMPTPRSYFAIDRPTLTEITALPEEDWWPRGLK